MRRGVTVALAALALLPLLAGASDAGAQVPVLHLDGRGFGHGVGLSQWGAKYAADAGASTEQILATFYPGTTLGTAGGPVRVAVHRAPSEAVLHLPQGGEVRSPREGQQHPGFPVRVEPGGSVVVRFDGSHRVGGGVVARSSSGAGAQCLPLLGPCPPPASTTTTTLPGAPAPPAPAPETTTTTAAPAGPPPSTAPPGEAVSPEPLWVVPADGGVVGVPARERAYRGLVQAVGGDGLRLVNEVDVETYLQGMGEVPASWPAAVQQAQAIAARTWVLRAMQASGEVCDFDRCQVYIGATRESPAQSAAVAATAGMVLTYGGALAASVYSADAGGVSATPLEGFGTPDGTYPYLTTVRYDTPDPLPWSLDVALADLAGRFGYRGTVTGVRISQAGPSGRALEVTLDGSDGPMVVPGRRFASGLGLRSTLFTPTVGAAASAPPAPVADPAFAEQAFPDDGAALAAALLEPPAARQRGAVSSRAERAAAPPPPVDATGTPVAAYVAAAAAGAAWLLLWRLRCAQRNVGARERGSPAG
jgi:stage II sporulation protein D